MIIVLGKCLLAASATSPPPTFVPTCAVFNDFRLIRSTDSELRKLSSKCNLKSCEFDPPSCIRYGRCVR